MFYRIQLHIPILESVFENLAQSGLSLRAGGRVFCPATMNVFPATFIGK